MPEPIESAYFIWLRAKVVDVHDPPRLYFDLMDILYRTEFTWILIGDKNREEDAKELRDDFLREARLPNDDLWYELPVSVFEVLIAFAKRASFQTGDSTAHWFHIFLENLGLDGYRSVSRRDRKMIDSILEIFIYRMYDESGYGGLFPMREPKNNQKEVEIWYQFCEWLEDRGLL